MEVVTRWLRYYLIFPKAVAFIWGLIVVHSWAEYALVALLINYLADFMNLPTAASVVNVLDGTTAVLMLVDAYVSETYVGPFLTVVCTTMAYISGLLLIYLVEGNMKSIGIRLPTMILIGLGRAGRDIQLKEFLTDQCRTEGPGEDEEQVESRRKIWWRSAYILGIIASVYLFTKQEWIVLCKISLIAMGIAFVLFLLGYGIYERKKPAKSTLNNMLRVLYVAITNRRHRHPLDYHRVSIRILRWLELDAATVEDQTRQEGVCTVEHVKQVKSFLSMLPLWSMFLIYGLFLATANTFFYQQTEYTANYLGQISAFSDEQSHLGCNDPALHMSHKVPEIIFVIIRHSVSFVVIRLCDLLLRLQWGDNIPRRVWLVRSGVGLAVSPICCLVAWRVEEYRVHQRIGNAVCVRFSWLIPQFVLVGLMEGLVFEGMQNFYVSMVPQSLQRYGPSFTHFALNIGHFVSLLFIFIFRHLFKNDLDLSRLGVYYRNLGYVCFANLAIYCCVATYYPIKESGDADEDIEQPLEQMHNLQEGGGAGDQQVG